MNEEGAERLQVQIPEKSSPIADEYGNLQRAIEDANQTACLLRDRLHLVLAPSRPTDAGINKDSAVIQLSPLAESLRSDAQGVYRMRAVLLDILDRLELVEAIL